MKKLNFILVLIVLYLIQNIVEATTYQVYRIVIGTVTKNNLIIRLVDKILRFSMYKFLMTVLIFLPVVLLLNAFSKRYIHSTFTRLAVINFLVNIFIVGFVGFYLEPFMFDNVIFYNTVLVSILFGLILTFFKPYQTGFR